MIIICSTLRVSKFPIRLNAELESKVQVIVPRGNHNVDVSIYGASSRIAVLFQSTLKCEIVMLTSRHVAEEIDRCKVACPSIICYRSPRLGNCRENSVS